MPANTAEVDQIWSSSNETDPVRLKDIRDVLDFTLQQSDMLFDAALKEWTGEMVLPVVISKSHFEMFLKTIHRWGICRHFPQKRVSVSTILFDSPMGPDNWYVSGNLTGPDEICCWEIGKMSHCLKFPLMKEWAFTV